MFQFLGWLNDQLARTDPRIGPVKEVSEGEVVVGEVRRSEVRRLFGLRQMLHREHAELLEDIERKRADYHGLESDSDHDSRTCPLCTLILKSQRHFDRLKAVEALLWVEVGEELTEEGRRHLVKGTGLGLRRGWQIVVPLVPDVKVLEVSEDEINALIEIFGARFD